MMRAQRFWRVAVVLGMLLLAEPLVVNPAQAAAGGRGLAWGNDFSGQLGDGGVSTEQPAPVAVSGLNGVVAMAAGFDHSLAVRSDGSVLAWGSDGSGQLGDGGANTDRSTPGAVSGLGAGSGVVAVAAGGDHSLALRADGSLLAWGAGTAGQLGDGGNVDRSTPVAVSGLGAGSGVVAVAAGFQHSLAVRADGSVMAWGDDSSGQLGDGGANVARSTPVAVSGLGSGSAVTAVAAGFQHSLAVRADGTVLTWGSDASGQLGDGGANADRSTPGAVSGLGAGSGVAAVAAGFQHSIAVRSNGSVMAWGSDFSGQLGDGGTNADRSTPGPVSGLGAGSGVVAVAAGDDHNLAVRSDGSISAWGSDSSGQLGDGGANADQSTPVAVSGLGAGSAVLAVAAGGDHSLAASPAPPAGPTFAPLSPARVWDSRGGPGPIGRIGAGQSRDITVTGLGGVPATGVTAVVLNVTAVGPSAGTFVTAWPTGETRPLASNLNVPPGDTRPNLVIVKVGAGGQVSFYNDSGTIDLIADIAGWYGAPGA